VQPSQMIWIFLLSIVGVLFFNTAIKSDSTKITERHKNAGVVTPTATGCSVQLETVRRAEERS